MKKRLPTIGWREWVGLPDLDTPWIKAKVDTGARTSSLHARRLRHFERDGEQWVRFTVHPQQRSSIGALPVEARLFDVRAVRSSSGESEHRPVIRTMMRLGDFATEIDVTLTLRDQMGFRMLLGREAIRKRFVVDAGRSFLTGKPGRIEVQ